VTDQCRRVPPSQAVAHVDGDEGGEDSMTALALSGPYRVDDPIHAITTITFWVPLPRVCVCVCVCVVCVSCVCRVCVCVLCVCVCVSCVCSD
jgi:hypothetical protein